MVGPLLYISHFKGGLAGMIWDGGGGGDGGGVAKGIRVKVVENVKGNSIWCTTRIVHEIRYRTCGRRIGEGYLISTQKAFRLRYCGK